MFHNTARSCPPEKHKGTHNDTSPISKKYFSQNKLVEMVLNLRIKSWGSDAVWKKSYIIKSKNWNFISHEIIFNC